jgi:hypothetical protein
MANIQKQTNNGQQNISQKTTACLTRDPLEDERIISPCFTSGTYCVTLDTYVVDKSWKRIKWWDFDYDTQKIVMVIYISSQYNYAIVLCPILLVSLNYPLKMIFFDTNRCPSLSLYKRILNLKKQTSITVCIIYIYDCQRKSRLTLKLQRAMLFNQQILPS